MAACSLLIAACSTDKSPHSNVAKLAAVQPVKLAAVQPGHLVRITVSTDRGAVGATFCQYYGFYHRNCYWHRDNSGPDNRIKPGHGANDIVKIVSHGTFVFDLSEWDDDPIAHVELAIDGITVWKAYGSGDNYNHYWNIIVQGKNVRITDPREIAIDL